MTYFSFQEQKYFLSEGGFFRFSDTKTGLLEKRLTLQEIAFSQIFLGFL
jgi:hypothetical protein